MLMVSIIPIDLNQIKKRNSTSLITQGLIHTQLPPVERKSISPPRLDDQRITPEKRDSPIPDTPPRLNLEENRDPDPDRINLNPVDPELNPIAPEGPVIPNIPEVVPEPNPELIPEVIPEDPELLEPEPEIIPLKL